MRRLLAALLLTGALSGCGGAPSAAPRETTAAAEPVTITMFGYWSDTDNKGAFASFKTALSEKFPEITLDYESFPTGTGPYTDELTRRLQHGEQADIVMTMDTSLRDSGKFMDLTGEEFTGRYSIAAMKRLSTNGTVYFLPGVGNVQCYVYNATRFAELGLTPPQTLDELESTMAEISAAGEHPFIVPYEQTRPLMIQVLAAGYLATPEGQLWLEDYNNGQATMKGNAQWEAIWQRAARMADAGYLAEADLQFAENRRMTLLSQGLGMMSTVSSSLVGVLDSTEYNTQGFRFGLFPLVGDRPENQTVFSVPAGYFAANSQLSLPGNEAKRDAVLKVFDFISTEAGQNAIRGSAPLANSYLRGVALPLSPQAQLVGSVLNAGAFGPTPVFARGVEAVLGDTTGRLIRGEITAGQAMEACDRQNADYIADAAPAAPIVLGTAAQKFPWSFVESRSQELAVTNFAVDSMKAAVGTELALELGTAIRGEFFKGDITDKDITSVVRVDRKIYRAQVTGQQLWDIVEEGVKVEASSWFVAVSGLKYSYRPAQGNLPGKLLSLTTADGIPIDLAKTYVVAHSENQIAQIAETYSWVGIPCEDTGVTLREAVVGNIKKQGTITPVLDGRITIA